MKATIIFTALAGSSVAIPLAPVLDAMFGTTFNNEARAIPQPNEMPRPRPIGTGSDIGFPLPTGTGALPPFPTASGAHPHPYHKQHHRPGQKPRALAIDYHLAPTVAPRANSNNQDSSPLPAFSLLHPTDSSPFAPPTGYPTPSISIPTGGFPVPSGTGAPHAPFPTGGMPPMPTGGLPGTGLPGWPTTLEKLTRGPKPTGMPAYPAPAGEEEEGAEGGAGEDSWGWLKGLFGGRQE